MDKNIILSHGAVAFMWEEHPEYQKAQAKAIGLGVGVLFVLGIVYCVSSRDWAHLKLVLSAAAGLAIALAILSLAARVIVKVFSRCQNRGKPQPNHGTDLSSRHDRET